MYEIEREEAALVERLKRSVEVCKNGILRLRQFVERTGFNSQMDEISFFKEMKPKLESLLLYHNHLMRIEIGKPFEHRKYLEEYYEKELQKINQYFKENDFLIQYYRGGGTFLDDKLFVRAGYDTQLVPFYPNRTDNSFASVCDHVIAEMLANEMLGNYLTEAIAKLNENTHATHNKSGKKKLKWTASKAALTEVLYGFFVTGCFNHGQAEIKEIAQLLEEAFDVDLGNYYRIFQELRIRKKDRTAFLKKLEQDTNSHMDDTDLNYKRG